MLNYFKIFIFTLSLFFISNIEKTYGKKEDILKAIHYLEMVIERDYNV